MPERVVANDDAPLAVEAAVPAYERDAALLEPRQLRGVVELVDHLVAPREHAARVGAFGADAGNAPRLGEELAGRSSAFEGMHA